MQASRNNDSSDFDVIKKKISNPASFGPGIWYCIHRMARDANTEEAKQKFKEFIENIIVNLPCTSCIEHATSYYKARPLASFWSIKENGKDVGIFRWTWEFHNTVNARLNKALISWENAKRLFSDEDGVCTSDCGGSAENVPVSMISEDTYTKRIVDPLQRFIPKNIIRPNSMEFKHKFRNA